MQHSEQLNELAAALAVAQAAIKNPPRNREVEVQTKSGAKYKFKYATLDAILDSLREPLAANGLSFTQTLANGEGKYRMVTTLLHKSGQWLSSEQPLLVDGGGNQAFGSALTYARRYAITAMLGIAADEDDDANAADGNEVKSSTERQKLPANGATKPAAVTRQLDILNIDHNVETTCAGIEQFLTELASRVKNNQAYWAPNADTVAWIDANYGREKIGKTLVGDWCKRVRTLGGVKPEPATPLAKAKSIF